MKTFNRFGLHIRCIDVTSPDQETFTIKLWTKQQNDKYDNWSIRVIYPNGKRKTYRNKRHDFFKSVQFSIKHTGCVTMKHASDIQSVRDLIEGMTHDQFRTKWGLSPNFALDTLKAVEKCREKEGLNPTIQSIGYTSFQLMILLNTKPRRIARANHQ